MATNFPTSLDAYAALVDGTDILEAADQNNVRDAIEVIEAKVGVNSSAVTTSHDYKIAQLEDDSPVTASGATIFNAQVGTANTWEDVNISGTVGSKTTWCYIEVESTVAGSYVAVKTKGSGGTPTEHSSNSGNSGGSAHFSLVTTGFYGQGVVVTDSAGKFEIACSTTSATLVIKLIAYIN